MESVPWYHLEDALGRMMSLPYEHFRYWPVLQARLQEAFTGVPGERKVKHNQFHIMNMHAGGNLVLTRKKCDRSVFPGSKLAMSMLYEDANFKEQVCPRCQNAKPWLQACQLKYLHVLASWHAAMAA